MNKVVNNNILTDDWSDNILIKDKSGKLYHLKEQNDIIEPNEGNIVKDITKTPITPHFEPVKTISGTSQDKADFGFHPDDTEQLAKIKETIPDDDSKKYSIKKIVDRLIEKQGLKFDKDNIIKFTDILYDFFRNRKNAVNTRLSLEQLKIGKSKIKVDIVDNIMSVVKGIKNKMEDVGGLVVKQEVFEERKPEKEVKPVEEKLKPVKKEFSIPKREEVKVEEPKKEVKSVEEPKKEVDSLPRVKRPSMHITVKKQVQDVVKDKYKVPTPEKVASPHVLSGSIEELKQLSLGNFRLLGESAEQSKEKLLNKINNLGKESFTKKSQGIEAWRQSEVYKEYLNLGNESMLQGKEISDIINDYKSKGRDTLSLEEFSAVSDINKSLRF